LGSSRGKWKQFGGRLREKWGKLTDDDWQVVGGKKDQLVRRIEERYGMAKEHAQREVDDFVRSVPAEDVGTQRTTSDPGKARRAGQQ
jgi:uncharacterized protein YjbJ (UPF0337 family)